MMIEDHIKIAVSSETVYTIDRFALAATLYVPAEGNVKKAIVLASALAVPMRFYTDCATWLAQQGYAVLTFDLRGMAASRPAQYAKSLRGFEGDFVTWAEQDFSAAVLWLHTRYPSCPLTVLGHSLGAQHVGLCSAPALACIDNIVAVGSGAGYWRDWAKPTRRFAPLMFYFPGPLLCHLFGYFPGARFGIVGDIPKAGMLRWIKWCRHPQFSWGAEPAIIGVSYARVTIPITAFSITDDEAMTRNCTQKLLAAYKNAPHRLVIIDPIAYGAKRIGHIGFFRAANKSLLWPLLLDTL
jgi:predicted alpha/beta hydrolase